jgi:flagellar biosynthesis chaperone FliJ
MSPIDIVNSFEDAVDFWVMSYGTPDCFSTKEDVTKVMEVFAQYGEELETLERYAKNVAYQNANHYKLNKCISLHFIVEAAEHYITLLDKAVSNNARLEKSTKKYEHPWEY